MSGSGKLHIYSATAYALLFCLLAASCSAPDSRLDRIRDRGMLHIATRNGPTTYYVGREGETGLEYELAERFAQELGVDLKVTVAGNTSEILDLLKRGKVDLAAAGLSASYLEGEEFVFGPGYQWVTHQVVYRTTEKRPETLADIFPDPLHLVEGALSDEELAGLREAHPRLSWVVHQDRGGTDLLRMLEDGDIRYAVIASDHFAFARQIHPEIRAAFPISDPRPLTWVMQKDGDSTLRDAVNKFYTRAFEEGVVAELVEYFYGPLESFDYVDSRRFVRRLDELLPRYRPIFEAAAEKYDFDWRLLAAISYQESHWNARARSPTGVRGMMMLTQTTAKRVGVKDRLDPEQSIRGGAQYLDELIDRLPDRIPEPDRTWLALAAYNVGMGHLEDARILAARDGADPDSWQDVRARLPRLSQSKWYKQTRFGYARGYEPVRFVARIRRYYNVIVQVTQPDVTPNTDRLVEAAFINSPVL